MKYFKIISAMLILFLLTISVGNSKPLPSLSVKMKWQGDIVKEVPMTLTLSVFSHVSVDDLEISLILPDGVTMLDGQTKVITSITGAKPLEKTYIVQINKTAVGYIKAEARLSSSSSGSNASTSGTAFYAAATLPVTISSVVNQKLSPRVEKKQDFKLIERDGVLLREYQLP